MIFLKRFSAATLFLSFLVMLIVVNTARAQQLDCSANVKKALQATNDKCSAMTRNKACYGSGLIDAIADDGVKDFKFNSPGDTVDVTQVKSMRLAPLDSKGTQWGVAYLRIQANLPDTTAGQYVTMLMFGDAVFDDLTAPVSTGAPAKTINAVYFGTGVGSPACHNAPTSGMLIQAPKGAKTVNLTVDGVQLGVNSTVFVQAIIPDLDQIDPISGPKRSTVTPTVSPTATAKKEATKQPTLKPIKPKLIITTIQGHVSVTTNGQTKIISNNQSATVTLNDGGDSPVDDPVVDNPPEDMQSLIDLTAPDGTDGLYLTQPDLLATEDAPSSDTNPDVPTDTPDANVESGIIPTTETISQGPTEQSTINDSTATPDGGSVNSSQQQSPTDQPPPTDPVPPSNDQPAPPPNDPASNPPPSDPGNGGG